MKKIKIITDSTSYIEKDYAEKENVGIVALNYTMGGESGKEGYPGEFKDFYFKLENSKDFPSTSQPSTGEFLDEFNRAFKEGYDEVIAILVSSKVSGTFNSACLAASILEDKRVIIIDSLSSSEGLKFLVEEAVEWVKSGKSSEEIEQYINQEKLKIQIYLFADTLEYLNRGGRLSSAGAFIGNLLNIKPIIQVKDGSLSLLDKIRGRNKAMIALIDKIQGHPSKIGICHVLDEEAAYKMKEILENKFPNAIVSICELGPVIGSHLGPKGLGICVY